MPYIHSIHFTASSWPCSSHVSNEDFMFQFDWETDNTNITTQLMYMFSPMPILTIEPSPRPSPWSGLLYISLSWWWGFAESYETYRCSCPTHPNSHWSMRANGRGSWDPPGIAGGWNLAWGCEWDCDGTTAGSEASALLTIARRFLHRLLSRLYCFGNCYWIYKVEISCRREILAFHRVTEGSRCSNCSVDINLGFISGTCGRK